ncbi:MAG: hypothetical protein K0S34_2435 [Bacillales bacterium]|nr:hypothetical protein [Bacillales bacterium]
MLRQKYFLGTLLIGFGFLFLSPLIKLTLISPFSDWRGVLFVLGISFLVQAILGKDKYLYFPSIILIGISLIFIIRHFDSNWDIDWPKFTFIIGIAYIFQNYKQKISTLLPILLTIVSLIFIFNSQKTFLSLNIDQNISNYFIYWPVILLLAGLYIIIKKR